MEKLYDDFNRIVMDTEAAEGHISVDENIKSYKDLAYGPDESRAMTALDILADIRRQVTEISTWAEIIANKLGK